MKNFKFEIGIILVLILSRFIPHPPNFTALIALSFYIPHLFGFRSIYSILIGLLISDIILGLHFTMVFTFFAVYSIGLISSKIKSILYKRVTACFFSAVIFFVISNFGVWISSGMYENSLSGLISCYYLAIPFFYSTALSTILYSILFELLLKLNEKKIISFEQNKKI